MSTSKTINPRNQVIRSNTNMIPEKIIVTFRGSLYDITNFVKKHPGGKNILLENNGKDIEYLMIGNGHSDYAYKLLEKYKIDK